MWQTSLLKKIKIDFTMNTKLFFSLLLLFTSLLLTAQYEMNLIPRENLFQPKEIGRVDISKDGKYVFYQKTDESSMLFYRLTDNPTYEKTLQFNGEIRDWTSTHDGGLLCILQQDTTMTVQYSPVSNRRQKDVTPFPFQRMKFVAASAKFPNKLAVEITAKEEAKSGLYLLDYMTGRPKRLGKFDGYSKLFLSDMFQVVAGVRPNDMGGNSILRRYKSQWYDVFEYPFDPGMFLGGLQKIISVSNDGTKIYATDNWKKDKTTLIEIDVETGATQELATDNQADIIPFSASIDPATGKPSSVVALFADTKRHILGKAVQADFDFLNEKLNNSIGYVGSSQDRKKWLVRRLDGGPNVYFLYNREKQELVELFNDFSALDDYDLATRHAFSVTTRDSLELPIHVYLPAKMDRDGDGIPSVPLPTIVYVHGGPWVGVVQWNQWFHTRNFQLLANRGYAVINMEFRGTTGLGKKVTDAGDLQWGEAMHLDIIDVVDWAIRNKVAYKGKIGMWGWSYGGYATNLALGLAPDLFDCGVSMYGIADLYKFSQIPFADNPLWRTRVGDPSTPNGEDMLKKYSPTTYIDKIKSPLLLTTGGKDERVPQSHVDEFASRTFECWQGCTLFLLSRRSP